MNRFAWCALSIYFSFAIFSPPFFLKKVVNAIFLFLELRHPLSNRYHPVRKPPILLLLFIGEFFTFWDRIGNSFRNPSHYEGVGVWHQLADHLNKGTKGLCKGAVETSNQAGEEDQRKKKNS